MNITQIEKNLEKLVENISEETFIYDLLRAYGLPKATITLLQKGTHNLAKQDDQIILKKKLLFQRMPEGSNLHAAIDELQHIGRHGEEIVLKAEREKLLKANRPDL